MADNVGWSTIVTAVVALYGAVLSTLNLVLARREHRRSVKVRLKWGLAPPSVYSEGEPLMLFCMEAANSGTRPVILKQPVIRLPTKDSVFFPQPFYADTQFPCELAEAGNCQFWVKARNMADAFQQKGIVGSTKLVAVFEDTLGKEHKSKPLRIDTDVVYKEAGYVRADG